MITFPLDALEAMDPLAGLKRTKRIAPHTSFFKSGICVGRTFVCVVKMGPLSSTIKIFEPIDQNIRGPNKPMFRKLRLADLEHDVELRMLWIHRVSKEIVDSVSDQEKAAAGSYHRGDLYRTRFRARYGVFARCMLVFWSC